MTSREIRQQFLDFFQSKKHTIVPSDSVVPADDPTLMFTNAGMNQFKDVFLGTGSRPYTRVANTQKCIRAGGKHNDLDDVGQDTYHHTLFEMLGNWSFGDYFKKQAIEWAWELLTGLWGIDKDRLYATYFEGHPAEGLEPDDEAAQLWTEVTDIDPSHVVPGNKKDNFWEMGDTGPCGPCSEIHIDLTPDRTGAPLVNAGDHRVIEIWNLVFIQYNRAADGKLTPLPAKHVDTGMGFERLCAVLQGMEQGKLGQVTNYDTDVFTPIFAAIRQRTGAPDYRATLPDLNRDRKGAETNPSSDRKEAEIDPNRDRKEADQVMLDVSYRVIADHLRCLTFALTDGALPSNEGRGYVLRRILRRAVRYGRQYMDMHEPFLCDLVKPLVDHMASAFPELRTAHNGDNVRHVCEILRDEEDSFLKTLDRGIRLFNEAADYAARHHRGRISGEDAFKLHDTYGFPVDLTELIAEERGMTVNIGEYQRLMEGARETARLGSGTVAGESSEKQRSAARRAKTATNDSLKYAEDLRCRSFLTSLARDTEPYDTDPAKAGETVAFTVADTCFYAEAGGQVSDTGTVTTDSGKIDVTDVSRHVVPIGDDRGTREVIVHMGTVVRGEIHPGDRCNLDVSLNRIPTMANHTSTHILNWALREVLGEGVQQKGSLVDPEKTRFDFSHNKPVTADELERVEALANQQIEAKHPIFTQEVDQAEARRIKALRAVFGEKYPDRVRVVSIGAPIGDEENPAPDTLLGSPDDPKWMKYSVEFCGGTHLANSGDAERFVLISEEGVAKGIRRVVGVSGEAARRAEEEGAKLLEDTDALITKASRGLQSARTPQTGAADNTPDLAAEVASLQRRINESVIPVVVRHKLRDKLAELQRIAKQQAKKRSAESGRSAMAQVATLLESAETVNGVTIVVGQIDDAPANALRGAIDWVRNKTQASAVLLASVSGGKVTLVAGMSDDVVAKGHKAGDLVREIAPIVGGSGGGKPTLAQAGGKNPEAIPEALAQARTLLHERLA